MRVIATSLLLTVILATPAANAQMFHPETRVPNAEALSEARKMVEQLFDNLRKGKSKEIAEWIVGQLGTTWSEPTKIEKKNEFKSKLDIILVNPPDGVYGKLDGYDLIDETYLPGSARYFRYTYISYHENAPLIWEYRFYVKSGGKVTLHNITWSEKNPFVYMSTSDMLLRLWLKD
jgi:hypothetical protein